MPSFLFCFFGIGFYSWPGWPGPCGTPPVSFSWTPGRQAWTTPTNARSVLYSLGTIKDLLEAEGFSMSALTRHLSPTSHHHCTQGPADLSRSITGLPHLRVSSLRQGRLLWWEGAWHLSIDEEMTECSCSHWVCLLAAVTAWCPAPGSWAGRPRCWHTEIMV